MQPSEPAIEADLRDYNAQQEAISMPPQADSGATSVAGGEADVIFKAVRPETLPAPLEITVPSVERKSSGAESLPEVSVTFPQFHANHKSLLQLDSGLKEADFQSQ